MTAVRAGAFVQVDSFSGVNRRLREALESVLDVTLPVVDVGDPRRLGRDVFLNAPWGNVLPMLRLGGLAGLRSPRTTVARRFSTPHAYRHRTRVARARTGALSPPWVLQTQTMFDARVPGVPLFVYTDHTMLAQRRYPVPAEDVAQHGEWIRLEAQTYAAAARIFVTSSFARTSLLEDYGCDAEQVLDVGAGCNLPVPDAVPLRSGPVREVLFVGFEWERKGGPVLLQALRRLRQDHPDVSLSVVGCSPDLREPGVRVLGRVSPERVAELMSQADVFCMPSWVEPSAGVYLEAAAYGLPVVATDVGGTADRVLHGETGWLTPVGDADAVHRHLERLVLDPKAARAQGHRGHELVRSRYTWQLTAQRVVAGMREVVDL